MNNETFINILKIVIGFLMFGVMKLIGTGACNLVDICNETNAFWLIFIGLLVIMAIIFVFLLAWMIGDFIFTELRGC